MTALTHKRVWLVEDDEALRELIALVLRKSGLDVVELETGRHLVDAAQHRELPDLVVTDHHMPMLHGLDALEKLRDEGLSIPAVLVTAFADLPLRTRAERLGARVIEKPCDVYHLRAVILAELDR